MKDIDYLALDGRGLLTFLSVLEASSVSAAAERLGVTQSAVSHTLAKLRQAVGDPLFVRVGRGIEPTARALQLEQPVRDLLESMKGLTDQRTFDPLAGPIEFTVAANDHQRALLFPALLNKLRLQGIDLRLRFLSSGVPGASLLNESRCQLLVTPFPPEGQAVFKQQLFEDRSLCFFDSAVRAGPTSWEDLAAREQVQVRFFDNRTSLEALPPRRAASLRKPYCSVANFSAVQEFVKGTEAICIAAGLMQRSVLRELDSIALPFETQPLPMYLVWHRRDQLDPAHRWLRQEIQTEARSITAGAPAAWSDKQPQ